MSTQFHSFALGGFPLTGEDDEGCLWTVSGIEGWFTGGEVRTSTQSKSQQAGSWRGKTFTDGRVFVFRGLVFAPSTAVLERAGRRLSSLMRDGSFQQLVGESEAGTFTSLVQMDATPQFTVTSDTVASWQVAVGSEDPLLYGPSWFDQTTLAGSAAGTGRVWARVWPRDWGVPPGVTAGSVTVPNDGFATYHPRLQIFGPVTDPRVSVVSSGDSLIFHGTIPSGQFITIDCLNRTVTYGPNADDVRYLTDVSGQWIAITPGGVTLAYDADTADATSVLCVYGNEGAWD